MSSPICLVTYHPAALLHAGKQTAGAKGLSKEGILRAITEDLERCVYILETIGKSTVSNTPVVYSTLTEPVRVPKDSTVVPSTYSLLGPIVGLDTEYLPDKSILTASFSNGVEVASWDRDLSPTDKVLLPEVDTLVGHNIPEDVALAWENGLIPRREEFLTGEKLVDSLLLARMVYEGQASYKLEDLLASVYTINPWKQHTSKKDVTQWTIEERVQRCELDAWAPYHLIRKQWPAIVSQDQQPLYRFTMGIAMTLHRLTLAGAFVDPPSFQSLVQDKERERVLLNSRLVQAASLLGLDEFSPQNDGHIRTLLFDKLELPILERTKKTKQPTVTKEILDLLAETAEGGAKGLLECLREFNRVDKTLTTYLTGSNDPKTPSRNAILRLARALRINDGSQGRELLWLPFHFHVLGAKTARRSSSNPNSQNWPKPIRRLVVSRWPGGKILAADYRKLEPVIIAWLAQDERLLEYFTTGGGYINIARDLFRTDVAEGTDLYRGVKSIVLGVHYDMGTDEMATQLWVNHKIRFSPIWEEHWIETDRIRDLYLATYPAIGRYMDRRRDEVRGSGFVRTPTGRTRSVGKTYIDKHVLNQAINAPVQSTASDVTGAALVDCERGILQEMGLSLTEWYDHLISQRRMYLTNGGTYGIMPEQWRVPTLFNEVHDELTVDIPPGQEKRHVELIIETMRAVPTLRALAPYLRDMPLYVDPKLGFRWGESG